MPAKYQRTERDRQYGRNYYRKYRKRNREKIRKINAKHERIHKDERNRKYREKWRTNEEFRRKKKAIWHGPGMKEKWQIYYKRFNLLKEVKWNKMHISTKMIMRLDKLLLELESTEPTGALDLKYLKQVKLRLDACKILLESWKKEYKLFGKEDESEKG